MDLHDYRLLSKFDRTFIKQLAFDFRTSKKDSLTIEWLGESDFIKYILTWSKTKVMVNVDEAQLTLGQFNHHLNNIKV